MNEKAQAAVEYLQTYGFAILVVIIVGVAMWQLGVFNPPKANTMSGFTSIKVLEPSIRYWEKSATGKESVENHLQFELMNTGGIYIHDLSIDFNGDCKEYIYFSDIMGGPCRYSNVTRKTLGPSETTNLFHSCCKALEVGDPFYIKVNISYTQRVGERKITKREGGVIQGYVESS